MTSVVRACLVLLCSAATLSAQEVVRVKTVLPEGELRPSSVVTLTFDKPVAERLEGLPAPARFVRLIPALDARLEWRDPSTIRIVPGTPLRPGSSLRVVIEATDVSAGVRLEAFERDLMVRGAQLVGSLPVLTAGGGAQLDITGRLLLRFSGDVDSVSLANTAQLVFAGGSCPVSAVRMRVTLRNATPGDPWPMQPRRSDDDPQQDRIAELRPETSPPEGCAGELEMVVPDEGKATAVRYRIHTAPRFGVSVRCDEWQSWCQTQQVFLQFTAGVQEAALRRALRVRPESGLRVLPSGGQQWMATLTVAPRDSVLIEIDSTLTDVNGRRLGRTHRQVLRLADHAPHLAILKQGQPLVVAREGTLDVPLQHRNVASALVRVRREPLSSIDESRQARPETGPVVWERRIDLSAPINTTTVTRVAVALPAEIASGTDILEVTVAEAKRDDGLRYRNVSDEWSLRRATYSVHRTNLMVHATAGSAGAGVLVTDVRTGAPQAKVAVSLHDHYGQEVGRALTDADGLARVTSRALARRANDARSAPAEWDDPLWPFGRVRSVVARTGPDAARLDLAGGFIGRGGYWPGSSAVYRRAAVHTDRDIYRPGEMLYFTGIVRDGWLGAQRPVVGERIRWQVRRAEDREEAPLITREATLSTYGTHTDSVRLPVDARLGGWVVNLERRVAGQWRIAQAADVRLAEYRAPEFLVTAALDSGRYVRGDSIRANATGRLLFDAPLVQGKGTWTATFTELSRWEIRIPGLGKEWEVGTLPNWWHGLPQLASVHDNGIFTTDASGRASWRVGTERVAFARGARMRLDIAVEDANGQFVSTTASTTVAGASIYIVARPDRPTPYWKRNVPAILRVGAVNLDGSWREREPMVVAVVRHEWRWTESRSWQLASDTIRRDSVVTRDSSATWTFTPDREGMYDVFFSGRDSAGRTTETSVGRWVVGGGEFTWGEDPTRLLLLSDRDSVKAGEQVTLTFSSPFDRAQAWIAVERDGVLHQERREVPQGEHRVSLRVTREWIPQVSATVTLVRMGDLSQTDSLPERLRHAERILHIDPAPRVLRVAVRTTRPRYAPGERATVELRVRDADGRGVRSEVHAWAVDDGVLAMTEFATPDPMTSFLANAARTLTFHTLLRQLARQHLTVDSARGQEGGRVRRIGFDADGNPTNLQLSEVVTTSVAMRSMGLAVAKGAAGADPFAAVRTSFLTTAFYQGRVRTDPGGHASLTVRMPDNLTTFRLMAVAVDNTDRAGSGEGTVTVTKPLLVRAAMPRFVRPGDTLSAGGVVNTRGRTTALDVQIAAQGDAVLTLTSPSRTSGRVDPAGLPVRFDWVASGGSKASIRLGVTGGGLQDAVEVNLPVRPNQRARTWSSVALVRNRQTMRVMLPLDLDPAEAKLTIRVGPSPLPMIRAWAHELRLYPYYCTEQLVSSGRAALALVQLHGARATHLADVEAQRAQVREAIRLLLQRQRFDGSFGYWTTDSWSTPWLSSYVGNFLLDASAVGFAVPEDALVRIGHYLSQALESSPSLPDQRYGIEAERRVMNRQYLSQRVAALDYLSRRNVALNVPGFLPLVGHMSFEDRARLALILSRDPTLAAEARAQLDALWRGVTIIGNRADLPDAANETAAFPSRIRPAARLLVATQAIAPAHPGIGPLAQRIIQRERAEVGYWWNTQDYAYASVAVAAFMRGDAASQTRYVLRGADGADVLAGTAGDQAVEREIPARSLLTPSGDSLALPIDVSPSGGPLYVTLSVTGPRREVPVAPEGRGMIVERWYERYDNAQAVTELQEGDLVRVRLRLTIPSDREFVALYDPLPAGLEAVDTQLRTSGLGAFTDSSTIAADQLGNRRAGGVEPWRAWWGYGVSGWEHTEMRDDAVVFHARMLAKGSHVVSYVARATTRGAFARPQAVAEEMYNPALSGNSEGGRFKVRPR